MKKSHDSLIMDLENKLAAAATDEDRINALNDIAWNIKYNDPKKAIELSNQAIELALEIKVETTLPKSYLSKAMGLLHLSRFEESEASAHAGLEIYKSHDNKNGLRSAHNILGSIYIRCGKLADALEHYLESMRVHLQLEEHPDPGILSNLGAVYLQLGETEKALDHFTRVTEMTEKMNGPSDLKTAALTNMGEIYHKTGMLDAALENYMKAKDIVAENDMKQAMAAVSDSIGQILTELERFDEAKEYLKEAMSIFEELGDTKGEAAVLINSGKCAVAENSNSALDFFLESLRKFRSINDSQGVSEALIGVAEVYMKLGHPDNALKMLSEAIEVASFMGLKQQLSRIHENLAIIFEDRGEFEKSLMHMKLFHELEDKIRSEKAARHLRNLRVVHQVEQARKEVALQRVRNVELETEKERLESIVKEMGGETAQEAVISEIKNIVKDIGEKAVHIPALPDTDNTAEEPPEKTVAEPSTVSTGSDEQNAAAAPDEETALQEFDDIWKKLGEEKEEESSLSEIGIDEQNAAPAPEEETAASANKSIPTDVLNSHWKVLIVENDESIVAVLSEVFRAQGYDVVVSGSPKDAFEILNEKHEIIACVITDVLLDEGSGIDLIRIILNAYPNIPVLAGSEYPLSKSDREFLDENRVDILDKPYNIDALMLKLLVILPE